MPIIASLRSGSSARGQNLVVSRAATPRVNVSLWIESSEPLCGITYRFTRTRAASRVRVHSRTNGAFPDVTQDIAFPHTIAPENEGDWGATVGGVVPLPPGLYRVATFNVSVIRSKFAKETSFSLDPISMVALTGDREQPLAATFTIRRG